MKIINAFILTVLLSICFIPVSAQTPKRQMRAVWVATVSNLDWPSKKGLSAQQQQAEMIRMLDEFKANNINTVIFQARPCADVFYESKLEPWSIWLSGKQGVAPSPYYDPLQFVIEEAHKRCMEVHVWVNPFRALNYEDVSIFSKDHIYNRRKNMFVKYAGKYYFDPGLKETRDYLNDIVTEIVQKYDIDAIHFDDYFYPYPVAKEKFNDDESFRKDPRGFTHRNDWRRDNINLTMKQLHRTIKSLKPWVDFGVSPFGIWRHRGNDPRGSATYRALSDYDDLYADVLKWLKDGDVDYVTPQLYWEIGKKNTNYQILAEWWAKNCYGRNLYIGLDVCGFNDYKAAAWHNPNELVRQIRLNKSYPNIKGEMFFRAKYFMQNIQGLNDALKQELYTKPALVPVNNSIKTEPSAQPKKVVLDDANNKFVLKWDRVEAEDGKKVAYYVVYAFKGKGLGSLNDAENIIGVTADNSLDITSFAAQKQGHYSFVVTSINRYRCESTVKSYLVKKF
jgi:uncharacterized lipoprotein YddW (UPF0748 family)